MQTNVTLQMMFTLFIKDILPALHDPTNPYDSQHKYVLVSLTDVKSILLVAEIHGADELLLRLFNSTFDGVSNSAKASADMQIAKDVEIHLTPTIEDAEALAELRSRARQRWENDRLPDGWTRPLPPPVVSSSKEKELDPVMPEELRALAERLRAKEAREPGDLIDEPDADA